MKGGKRPGAGRPKGASTRRKRAVALQAAAEGVAPIDVMLTTMRALYSEAIDEEGKLVDVKKATQAATLAKDAAPYIHPRLTSVEARGHFNFRNLDDAELDDRIRDLASQAGVAGIIGGEK